MIEEVVVEDGWAIEATGVYATLEQIAEAVKPVHWADFALTGNQPPSRKVVEFALAAGLEQRDDGRTRFALDTESREFLYVWPLAGRGSSP